MKKKIKLILIPLVLFSAFWFGCPPPLVMNAPRIPGDLTGVYLGNHTINFDITSPIPRAMPPEVRQGPIHVNDEPGPGVRLSLRFYDNGEPCHLEGIRQGGTGRVIINPNQRCSLRMLYENNPVIVGLQINQGVADFEGWNLRTDMSGPFVAETLYMGRRTSLQGRSRIGFSGTRQQSR